MPESASVTAWVTHHEGETYEDEYRPTVTDQFGYEVPTDLVLRLAAAIRELAAANEAVKAYLEANGVPEIDLDDEAAR